MVYVSGTSAENILTGIPKARARPKSASFNSPFYLDINMSISSHICLFACVYSLC